MPALQFHSKCPPKALVCIPATLAHLPAPSVNLLLGMLRTNFPLSRLRCAWGTSTLKGVPSGPAAGMRFIVKV